MMSLTKTNAKRYIHLLNTPCLGYRLYRNEQDEELETSGKARDEFDNDHKDVDDSSRYYNHSSDYDSYYDSDGHSDMKDFAACDQECGYCVQCDY